MIVSPIRTRIFKENEDLVAFILAHVPSLKEGSVLVITSKIGGLAEGRTANIRDKTRVVREESDFVAKAKYVFLTMRGGVLMASGGVDESNAAGKLVLLPRDSYALASRVRTVLMKAYRVKKLGVLITDSRVMPLRAGTTAIALGYAGFKGLKDYRGTKDLFGKIFKYSRANIADGLASAAVVAMGEGTEQMPLAVISDAPVEFVETVRRNELVIPAKDDMHRPFLHIPQFKQKKR